MSVSCDIAVDHYLYEEVGIGTFHAIANSLRRKPCLSASFSPRE